jgi:hypothetical protein
MKQKVGRILLGEFGQCCLRLRRPGAAMTTERRKSRRDRTQDDEKRGRCESTEEGSSGGKIEVGCGEGVAGCSGGPFEARGTHQKFVWAKSCMEVCMRTTQYGEWEQVWVRRRVEAGALAAGGGRPPSPFSGRPPFVSRHVTSPHPAQQKPATAPAATSPAQGFHPSHIRPQSVRPCSSPVLPPPPSSSFAAYRAPSSYTLVLRQLGLLLRRRRWATVI